MWQWQRTDLRTGAVTKLTHTIGPARPDGGYLVVFGDGRTQKRDANFQVEPEAGAEFKVPWNRWPLRVGDRWTWEVPVKVEAGNGTATGGREVVSAEKVVVPAGEFECLKIESQDTRMIYDARRMSRPNYSSSRDTTTWYCPSIRHFAKQVETWRDGYGGLMQTEIILINYFVSP